MVSVKIWNAKTEMKLSGHYLTCCVCRMRERRCRWTSSLRILQIWMMVKTSRTTFSQAFTIPSGENRSSLKCEISPHLQIASVRHLSERKHVFREWWISFWMCSELHCFTFLNMLNFLSRLLLLVLECLDFVWFRNGSSSMSVPSVLWHCWLGGRNSIRPVKMGDGGSGHWLFRMEWRPAGWSVCLPLLIFPCTIKSRSSLLAPAHVGGPRKRP